MNTKIANTARIRRTTVLAAGMWVVFALALAFTTMSLYPRMAPTRRRHETPPQ